MNISQNERNLFQRRKLDLEWHEGKKMTTFEWTDLLESEHVQSNWFLTVTAVYQLYLSA